MTPLALYGVNPQAAIEAIRNRRASATSGVGAADGRKLGLIIEGGGLRGVSSAGGVVALAQFGYCDVFDEVYATSSGVMNASYFISNQPVLGIRVYFEHCTRREFINPLRFWKVLNVDYIFDEVVSRDKRLDVDRVLGSRSHLFVAVIDKDNGEAFMVDTRTTRTPLLQVLKAATAIPVLYNRTIDIDGRPCMDGGLGIPFPLQQALDRGCTDVLVLTTRPATYVRPRPGWLGCLMFDWTCAQGRAGLNRTFAARHLRSREARDLAFGRIKVQPGVNIATICTDATDMVGRLSTDRKRLHAAAEGYGRKTLEIFGIDGQGWSIPPNV